jgi:hypothetical protein
VVATHVEYVRYRSNWVVTVRDADGVYGVKVWHRNAFWKLQPGDAVTARHWNGRPVAFLIWGLTGIDVWPAVAVSAAILFGLVSAGHLRHQSQKRARPGG